MTRPYGMRKWGAISEPNHGAPGPEPDTQPCGCSEWRDYDGERMRNHCDEHCKHVQAGEWEHCGGC